jgi:hypothetical protein
VDEHGRLVVDTADGERTFTVGDVVHASPAPGCRSGGRTRRPRRA